MNIRFIYLETYGCSANQNNSEIMRGILVQSGLQFTDNPKIADILIINTCIVKEPTENKIKSRINELSKLGKPIIIAGCMPEVRKIKKNNIYSLGISHIKDIAKLVKRISEERYSEKEFLEKRKEIKLGNKLNNNKLVGITQISEGCLGNCNYCLTKLVKGNLFSYPEDEILENVEWDIKNGCKEIWLTSQDNASYGLDSGTNLVKLLRKILEIPGKYRIRIGMMNPNHILPILDELTEVYKDERIYKFLHLPLQSGSDKILKSMGRKYTSSQFLNIVSKFRKQIPELILAIDVILAYPGETEQDYKETLKIIEQVRPDVMNLTRYWPMSGTRAAILPQLSRKIASQRAAEVQKLHLRISEENNRKYLGKQLEVFVNEQQGTNCLARTGNYVLVVIRSNEKLLGKKLKVKVKQVFAHYLLAEII